MAAIIIHKEHIQEHVQELEGALYEQKLKPTVLHP